MARKICSTGVIGSYSFIVIEDGNAVISSIKDERNEIKTVHLDIQNAEQWTDRKLRELVGKQYEIDGI